MLKYFACFGFDVIPGGTWRLLYSAWWGSWGTRGCQALSLWFAHVCALALEPAPQPVVHMYLMFPMKNIENTFGSLRCSMF